MSPNSYRLIVVAFAACAPSQQDISSESAGQREEAVYADYEAIWEDHIIPVCWEDPLEEDALEREWTRSAVAASWELYADIEFIGWEACEDASRGIRIGTTAGEFARALGNELDGMPNGVMLDFTDKPGVSPEWNEFARRAIAVHEFGHALGLSHEQNRPDTEKSWCDQEQGPDGNVAIGLWDLHSVMNYCNPEWVGSGKLSETDIAAIEILYGPASLKGSIVNVETDKCVSVANASLSQYAAVVSTSCTGGEDQRWTLGEGDESASLYSVNSGLCLGAASASPKEGDALLQLSCTEDPSRRFKRMQYADGSYELRSGADDRLCLDVPGGNVADAVPIKLWSCHGGMNQRFFMD